MYFNTIACYFTGGMILNFTSIDLFLWFCAGSTQVLLEFCSGFAWVQTFCLRNDFDYVPIVSNNFLGGEDWTQFASIEFQALNFGGWGIGLNKPDQIVKYKNTRQNIENANINMKIIKIKHPWETNISLHKTEDYWIFVAIIFISLYQRIITMECSLLFGN